LLLIIIVYLTPLSMQIRQEMF